MNNSTPVEESVSVGPGAFILGGMLGWEDSWHANLGDLGHAPMHRSILGLRLKLTETGLTAIHGDCSIKIFNRNDCSIRIY